MKKILSLLICASMILPTAASVYAEENVITVDSITYDCGSMTVSGTLASEDGAYLANTSVTIKLAQGGAGPEGVALLDEAKTDENGAFKITAQLPAEKDGLPDNGIVTLYVKARNISAPNESTAYYVKKSERDKVIGELAEISSAGEMTDKLELQNVKSTLAVIGIDMSYFDRLSAGKIAEVLAASDAFSDKSEQAVKKTVNGALWVADVNNGNSHEVLKIWNPIFRDIAFNDITDSEKQNELAQNLDNGKSYANFDALEKAYTAANVLYDINRARSGEVEEILTLASECGLDNTSYSSYKNMDYTKKTVVGDALVKSIAKSKVGNMTELNSLFAAAISEASNTKPGNTGGSTGSAGSGATSGKGGITTIPNGSKTDINKLTEPVNEVNLTDMDSASWAKEAVEALAKRGIVSGYDDGTFRPNNGVKREEFIKMLSSAIGMSSVNAKCSYEDVPEDAWYYPYVSFCTEKNIVHGISETKFGTGMEITRQDMATIIYRAAGTAGKSLGSVRTYKPFDDENEIGNYALEAVRTLYSAGKISGVSDALFLPNNVCTRAQVAKVIYDVFVNKSLPSNESVKNTVSVNNNTSSDNTSAGTAPADVKKINYDSKAIGVLEGLGIAAGYTSDNFDENAVVTAGRFINMLLNITSDSAYTGDTVSDEGLQKAGLYGFAESRADAEEKSITYGNAVKMTLDFLGYKQLAEKDGGYPSGYLKAVSTASLDAGSIDWEEKLTAGAAAALLYSAIKAKPVSMQYTGGNMKYEIADGENVLEYYRNIYVITGLMDRNSLTYLTNGNVIRMNYAGIDGELYEASDYIYDELLGYSVEAYIQKDDGGTPKLIYAMPNRSKNKVLNLDLKNVEKANDTISLLTYSEIDGARTKTAKLNAALKVIYNKKAYNSFNKDDFLNKRGRLTLIDNDSDGVYDVAKIDAYEVMVVKSVNSKGIIANKFTYDGAVKTLKTEDIDVTVIRDGAVSDIQSLREFDVLNVYSSKQETDGCIEIYASSKTSSGTLNSMNLSNKDDAEITVGADIYEITSELFDALQNRDSEIKQLQTGSIYSVYTDAFGDAAWIAETNNITAYGYLRRTFTDESGTDVQIDILTTNNEWLQLFCANKLKYNDVPMSKEQFLANVTSEPQLIEYKINGSEEVTSVKTAVTSQYNPEVFTTTGKKTHERYCRGDYAFDSRVFLNDGANIFIVPADTTGNVIDKESCGVVSASYLINEKYYDYQAYNCDKYGYSDVFVVYTTLDNFKPNGQTPLFLVESKQDVSADGVILTMVNGASDGSKMSVSAEAEEHLFDDIDKGDIISITTGIAGKIYVEKYYDYTKDGSNDTEDLTINEWDEKRCGVLKEIDLNKKRLMIGSDATRTLRWFDNISVSIYDAESDEVIVGSLKDLQEGDYLWIRLAWRQMKEVVAIRHK